MHALLCALCSHAYTYRSRIVKIVVRIQWTLLSNFHFLHHPQILHCLKAITKYKNVHAHLCALCLHACTNYYRREKISVSIHLTFLSNFHFLHHLQILHCLKAITKYRNMHVCLCALRSHACTYHSQFFFRCILLISS